MGYPNVGKSSILNRLTNKVSEIGSYAFTTLRIVPGTMNFNGAQIQILDLPGIIENAATGSGRGREVLSAVRSADLILLVLDIQTKGIENIITELHTAGIAVGRRKKNIYMKKTNSGGVRIYAPKNISIKQASMKEILKEFKITNCELYIREKIDIDDLVDFLRGNVIHLPALIAVNKCDLPYKRREVEASLPTGIDNIYVSAETGMGIERLRSEIFSHLDLVRIFMREKSGITDYERPMILRSGVHVRDVCRRISREMLTSFKYAIILNDNRKLSEMRVGLDYSLEDGDIVTLISRN